MKIRTIIIVFLLLFFLVGLQSCKSQKLPTSDYEVQKELYKKKKKEQKAGKKLKKQQEKHFWSLQSKEVKKSLRKNRRFQRRKARKMNK